jgi:hypothetical protein
VYDVPADDERTLVADMLEELTLADQADPRVEIYGMHWVLDALGREGRHAAALELIRRHYGRLVADGLVRGRRCSRGVTAWRGAFRMAGVVRRRGT